MLRARPLRARPMLMPTILVRMCASLASSTALLPTRPLPYRGVLVEVSDAEAAARFAAQIEPSLVEWQRQGHKSCMLRVSIEHSQVAAHAAEHGFVYHHAEGQHAVLKRWLQPILEDKVPPYATHQVGVAGLCMDKMGRILLVKEWRDVPASEGGGRVPSSQWKLPGGMLERGESFSEAVEREILEETGIRCNFRSIVSFWHRHGLLWGKSDLYYVARLELRDETECTPTPQPDEISAVTWMHADEFLATQDHPLIRAVLDQCYGLSNTPGPRSVAGAPVPLVEMVEGGVQWPGREPYPTYFGTAGV